MSAVLISKQQGEWCRKADAKLHPPRACSATVGFWPEAFFIMGSFIFFLAFLCLLFVRIRRPKWSKTASQAEAGASEFSVMAQD